LDSARWKVKEFAEVTEVIDFGVANDDTKLVINQIDKLEMR
jgi:hypothetical protein